MHTPEPWRFYDDTNDGKTNRIEIVATGKTIARIYQSVNEEDLPNARRIVACVNLCAGIPIERLEKCQQYDAKAMVDLMLKWYDERNELLKALKELTNLAGVLDDSTDEGGMLDYRYDDAISLIQNIETVSVPHETTEPNEHEK